MGKYDYLINWWYENRYNISKSTMLQNNKFWKEIVDLTYFLDEYYTKIYSYQRIWHIKNNIFELQTCEICGNITQYSQKEQKYTKSCSEICNNAIKSKRCIGNKNAKCKKDWFKEKPNKDKPNKFLSRLEKDGCLNNGFEYIKYVGNNEHLLLCKKCNKQFKIHSFNQYYYRIKSGIDICVNCTPLNSTNHTNKSKPQAAIYEFILKEFNGVVIKYDYFSIINNKKLQIDMFLCNLNLGFEFNGDFWHMNPKFYKEDDINKRNYKLAKDIWTDDKLKICEYKKERNIDVYTIWNNDWNIRPNVVKRYIKLIINNKLNYIQNG